MWLQQTGRATTNGKASSTAPAAAKGGKAAAKSEDEDEADAGKSPVDGNSSDAASDISGDATGNEVCIRKHKHQHHPGISQLIDAAGHCVIYGTWIKYL